MEAATKSEASSSSTKAASDSASSKEPDNSAGSTMPKPPKLHLLHGLQNVSLRNSAKPPSPKLSLRKETSTCSGELSEIKPYLFLGGDLVAKDAKKLEEHAITHILNSAHTVCPNYHEGSAKFEYLSFDLVDIASESISYFLVRAIVEIERVRNLNGKILVHCHQGISRSSTLVIAYLMWADELSFDEAFKFVKERRTICSPNMGFMVQLRDWETRLKIRPKNPVLYRVAEHSEQDSSLVAKPVMAHDTDVGKAFASSAQSEGLQSETGEVLSREDIDDEEVRQELASKLQTSTFEYAIPTRDMVTDSDAIILFSPSHQKLFVWIGPQCPDRDRHVQAANTLSKWMSIYEPCFSKAQPVEVQGVPLSELGQQSETEGPSSAQAQFLAALSRDA